MLCHMSGIPVLSCQAQARPPLRDGTERLRDLGKMTARRLSQYIFAGVRVLSLFLDARAEILSRDLQVRLLAAAEDGIHPLRLPRAVAPSSLTSPLQWAHSLWPQLGFAADSRSPWTLAGILRPWAPLAHA